MPHSADESRRVSRKNVDKMGVLVQSRVRAKSVNIPLNDENTIDIAFVFRVRRASVPHRVPQQIF
jgi:hypothetical protein